MLAIKERLYSEAIKEYGKKAEAARKKKDILSAKMFENFVKGFTIKLEKVRLAIQAGM